MKFIILHHFLFYSTNFTPLTVFNSKRNGKKVNIMFIYKLTDLDTGEFLIESTGRYPNINLSRYTKTLADLLKRDNVKSELLAEVDHNDAVYTKFIESIKQNGIQKRTRQHVHLSTDIEKAIAVGKRHGNPVVLKINAKQMFLDGYKFYLSENGVWLTDNVPYQYVLS